jgi:hypothetical protein
MTEARREQWFTAAAITLLLGLTAFDNAWLLAGAALALLAVGLVALPRQRVRGALAAVLAACVAVVTVTLIRWLQ